MPSKVMTDLRRDVDQFLANTNKRLPARPAFERGTRPSQKRAAMTIEVDGESSGFSLELTMTPTASEDWVRIVLLYGRAIWRLCLKPEYHSNSFNRSRDLPSFVDGPHHHSWADNRRFARANSLPHRLENARILPNSIVTKDQAFRWFLGVTSITIPDWGMPDWPRREVLI